MARPEVQFLRDGYEALQRGDIGTFTALSRERLHQHFQFHLVCDGRVLRGLEGTLELLSDTRETWNEYTQEVEEIEDPRTDQSGRPMRLSKPAGAWMLSIRTGESPSF